MRGWEVLESEFNQPYMQQLMAFLKAELRENVIFPPIDHLFFAFKKTSFLATKVVIVGQEPYQHPGQAHGLCFSVSKETPLTPSLKNIFSELEADLHIAIPGHGCLEKWSDQGVLMLNAVMSIRSQSSHSHQNKGWEKFTDKVIQLLAERINPPIFVFWGKEAQKKAKLLTGNPSIHYLVAPHPSPHSAYKGFFGCRHFSKINKLLERQGELPIDWSID